MDFLTRLPAGTLPQWGMFATLLAIAAGLVTAWIKGIPDRVRAENEGKALDHAEAGRLRAEFTDLHKQDRADIHDLRNRLQAVAAKQSRCERELITAHAENRTYRDDMQTLLFLIRLLISEVKRLDDEPANVIITQAELTLTELERKREEAAQTPALSAAEDTVRSAEHTLAEVKADERRAT